jgi:hypothetical protein
MMNNKMLSWIDNRKPNITAETVKPYMKKYGMDLKNAEFVAEVMTEIFAGMQITETSAMSYELLDTVIRHDAETKQYE